MSTETQVGWGYLDTVSGGTLSAHYFPESGRSLCGKWLALGTPRWLLNQDTPPALPPAQRFRRNIHCKACWKKRRAQEAK